MRAEVRDADPGQDQEARVVDDERQVLLAPSPRPADEAVARGERQGGGGETEHGERRAVVGVHGVAHLGADQRLVAEVVVAGDVLVPQLPPAVAAHDGAHIERADRVERGRRRQPGRFGVGPERDRPGPVLAPLRRGHFDPAVPVHGQLTTRAIMSLSPPSALYQPMRRQNCFDRAWRLSVGGPAISARSNAISVVVKSRPY